PHGDQRDGRQHPGDRLLHPRGPAHLRDPRDVVGNGAARSARLPVQPRLQPHRASRAAVAPRSTKGSNLMTDEVPMLEVEALGKVYGSGAQAVHAIDEIGFTVARSEFVCVVGPSGCGKTTLLRCLSGLMPGTRVGVRVAARGEDGD